MSHQDSGEPAASTPPRLFKVAEFSKRHPFLTEASLRNEIHCSKERQGANSLLPANGLENAIVRKGRTVLVDEVEYFAWLERRRRGGKHQ